jgi:hypothetical protein
VLFKDRNALNLVEAPMLGLGGAEIGGDTVQCSKSRIHGWARQRKASKDSRSTLKVWMGCKADQPFGGRFAACSRAAEILKETTPMPRQDLSDTATWQREQVSLIVLNPFLCLGTIST